MAVGNKKGEPPKFLSGWKEIASYLGKGVRTVQRYEREMGLPVRRPAGKSRAAVVATKAELDAWVAVSPYRYSFSLPRIELNNEAFTANLKRGITEMRRLRDQMFDLREEVQKTVITLRESIQEVRNGVSDSWSDRRKFSVADFESRRNPFFTLVGTRVNGKAS
jgi:hypothetical protein